MALHDKNIVDDAIDEAVGIGITVGVFKALFGRKKKKKVGKEVPVKQFNHKPVYDQHQILEEISGDYSDYEEFINTNKSTIGLIVGARGTGKSAIAMRMLENLKAKTNRNCMAMGFNAAELPNWIKCVDDLENLENDSFIVIDEGGILFSSRSSMSGMNKMLSSLILVARHKNISILFITQNSSNIDINIIRQVDYMVMKPSSLLQLDFERKKIADIYKEVTAKFEDHKNWRGVTYIYSDRFQGFFNNNLPSFWNEDISKNFKEN